MTFIRVRKFLFWGKFDSNRINMEGCHESGNWQQK
jgi:hypothetical protein